ncbi:hypothetical protein MG293_001519 [Ovis ammon polii]|uniref:Uncharacterized protein n=1 Tax=Ovis ammon polii TaxID=230172 RepID=A0AAD4YI49_OVIAM|nr:hypothetical protein MG293_001519 [Ovis ammon polii]
MPLLPGLVRVYSVCAQCGLDQCSWEHSSTNDRWQSGHRYHGFLTPQWKPEKELQVCSENGNAAGDTDFVSLRPMKIHSKRAFPTGRDEVYPKPPSFQLTGHSSPKDINPKGLKKELRQYPDPVP